MRARGVQKRYVAIDESRFPIGVVTPFLPRFYLSIRCRYREPADPPRWRRATSSPSAGARALKRSQRNGSEAHTNGRLERWTTCALVWQLLVAAPPSWRPTTTPSCGLAIATATWRPRLRTFLQTCSCHGRPQRARPSSSHGTPMVGRALYCFSPFRPLWRQLVRFA